MSLKLINNGTSGSLKLLNRNNLSGKLSLEQSASPPAYVSSGLVLYVDAGNLASYPQSGTTWYDLSGQNNNGTHVAGPTFDSANGGSIVYNNNYTTFGDPPSLSITPNATINVWYKTTNPVGWRGLVAKRNLENDATNYGINFNTFASMQVYYNASGFQVVGQNYAGNYNTNVWYNICGTFAQNGGNTDMILYKNAVPVSSATRYGNLITNNTPLIVGATGTGGEFLEGNISIVQIYNRTLTPLEVQQNYDFYKERFGL